MDKLSEQQRRSANMAAIRGKDTKPEMIVRRGLWKRGFRYRLYHKRLPGHPDLVLKKYRTCIFVNGCFWHGHKSLVPNPSPKGKEDYYMLTDSECCKIPKTNREFWVAKIRRNQERDKEEQRRLAEMGWHCITVWECELKPQKREATLDSIAFTLNISGCRIIRWRSFPNRRRWTHRCPWLQSRSNRLSRIRSPS